MLKTGTAKSLIPIGIVLAVSGYVVVERMGGLRKLLSLGDLLHGNDHIESGDNADLVIGFMDGSSIELGANGEAVLDNEVFDLSALDNLSGFESILNNMQQSLLDGDALSDILDGASSGFNGLTAVNVADAQDTTGSNETEISDSLSPPATPPEQYPIGGDTEIHSPPEMILPKLSIASMSILEPQPGRGDEESHDETEHDSTSYTVTGHDTTDEGHDTEGHDTEGHDTEGHDSGGDESSHEGGGGGGDYSAGHGGGYGYAGGTLTSTAIFTISLSSPATREVSVDFRTVDGTAISGGSGVAAADYGHTSGTVVIPVGEIEATIEVTIFSDRLVESNEQFYLVLSNPVNAVIDEGTAIGTILESGHGEGEEGEGQILVGTDGDDTLITQGGPDVLDGKAGNDTLIAGGGEDTIYGGEGDDLIVGLGGADKLYGGEGNDEIIGHGGRDLIDGGEGDDIIYAGGAPDVVSGGPGDDFINAEGGPDIVDGGEGNDTIYGGGGPDTLDGGAGNDMIYGQGGPDDLRGGAGNDQLFGGGGPDILTGGAGDDIMQGSGGGDLFRFEALDGSVDHIVDFTHQDQIDISAILDITAGDPISQYVQITPSDSDPLNYELSINPGGTGNVDDFQVIAVLDNLQTAPDIDELVNNGNLIVIE